MQYACFACRKVFKKPIAAESEVDYPCPACAQPLIRMGTAFRAPRNADTTQWRKVEKLARAGILFYRNSGPRPRNLSEVPEFINRHARSFQSPGERMLESIGCLPSRTSSQSQGRLKQLNTEGKPEFALAGRNLEQWTTLWVHDGNQWLKGIFRSTGAGGKTVHPHMQVGQKKILIGPQTILRWPE